MKDSEFDKLLEKAFTEYRDREAAKLDEKYCEQYVLDIGKRIYSVKRKSRMAYRSAVAAVACVCILAVSLSFIVPMIRAEGGNWIFSDETTSKAENEDPGKVIFPDDSVVRDKITYAYDLIGVPTNLSDLLRKSYAVVVADVIRDGILTEYEENGSFTFVDVKIDQVIKGDLEEDQVITVTEVGQISENSETSVAGLPLLRKRMRAILFLSEPECNAADGRDVYKIADGFFGKFFIDDEEKVYPPSYFSDNGLQLLDFTEPDSLITIVIELETALRLQTSDRGFTSIQSAYVCIEYIYGGFRSTYNEADLVLKAVYKGDNGSYAKPGISGFVVTEGEFEICEVIKGQYDGGTISVDYDGGTVSKLEMIIAEHGSYEEYCSYMKEKYGETACKSEEELSKVGIYFNSEDFAEFKAGKTYLLCLSKYAEESVHGAEYGVICGKNGAGEIITDLVQNTDLVRYQITGTDIVTYTSIQNLIENGK